VRDFWERGIFGQDFTRKGKRFNLWVLGLWLAAGWGGERGGAVSAERRKDSDRQARMSNLEKDQSQGTNANRKRGDFPARLIPLKEGKGGGLGKKVKER